MPQLRPARNIQEYAPGDIPQFSNLVIYVHAFSFQSKKIVQLNRTGPFKQNGIILNAYRRVCQTVKSIEKRSPKYFKHQKDNNLHWGLKYARILVLGHYLFLEACSFPQSLLSENCSHLRIDNVLRQIPKQCFRTKWRLLFIYIVQ